MPFYLKFIPFYRIGRQVSALFEEIFMIKLPCDARTEQNSAPSKLLLLQFEIAKEKYLINYQAAF